MKALVTHWRQLVAPLLILCAASCASLEQFAADIARAGPLSSAEVSAGLKEALAQGASRAVTELGTSGGFNSDTALRITFPAEAQPIAQALNTIGLGGLVTGLEKRLNDGAESGARRALPIFKQAIQSMTIADATAILTGGEHAATDYFRARTYASLTTEFRPEIESALSQTGATIAWRELTTRYNQIPFSTYKADTDLVHYATERALDGLFTKIAAEEASIRADPVARTTALLKRVFGSANRAASGG